MSLITSVERRGSLLSQLTAILPHYSLGSRPVIDDHPTRPGAVRPAATPDVLTATVLVGSGQSRALRLSARSPSRRDPARAARAPLGASRRHPHLRRSAAVARAGRDLDAEKPSVPPPSSPAGRRLLALSPTLELAEPRRAPTRSPPMISAGLLLPRARRAGVRVAGDSTRDPSLMITSPRRTPAFGSAPFDAHDLRADRAINRTLASPDRRWRSPPAGRRTTRCSGRRRRAVRIDRHREAVPAVVPSISSRCSS